MRGQHGGEVGAKIGIGIRECWKKGNGSHGQETAQGRWMGTESSSRPADSDIETITRMSHLNGKNGNYEHPRRVSQLSKENVCATNEVFKWSNKEPMCGVDGSKNVIKDEEVHGRIVINGSKNMTSPYSGFMFMLCEIHGK